ncbi:MAG: CDP-glycerol glycerophosphotransferase family protein [Alphaproteobacteria bacterium]|nr:CDP-glycerol glycerophosphotransferase family protein [Alphaproteobacteria bacterium]
MSLNVSISVFSKLPFMTIVERKKDSSFDIKIFKYISFLTVRKKMNKMVIKLFRVIPIIKILSNNNIIKCYLLKFIPLFFTYKTIKKGKSQQFSEINKLKSVQYAFCGIPLISTIYLNGLYIVKLFKYIPFLYIKINGYEEWGYFFDKNKLKYNKNKKVKIYFLFLSKAFWPSWQSFYKSCIGDKNIDVKLIYCPVTPREPGKDGQFIDAEDWLKKQKIPYTHIDNINIFKDKPHVIVMQLPYDGMYPEKYRSSNLKYNGMRVVYISYGLYFTENKMCIWNQFQLPIYRNAWKLFPFAEFLRDDYVRYGNISKDKLVCLGHPKFDALYNAKKVKLPDELTKKIGNRKVIVWHVHFPFDYSQSGEQKKQTTFTWEDNVKILNFIIKQKDLFFIFMPHHMFFGAFEHSFNISPQKIKKFKDKLQHSSNTYLWEGDYPEILALGDAFIGERSSVTMEMLFTKKPVCYLESLQEIYNKFGRDALKAFSYANTANDVIDFIEQYKKGEDNKKMIREQVFDKYIHPYFDGKCGLNIKNEIITFLQEEDMK